MRGDILRGLLPAIIALSGMSACASDTSSEPGSSASEGDSEVEFGLGSKADGMGCSPSADLCWPSEEQATMRSILRAEDTLLLGLPDPRSTALDLIDEIEGLSEKLTTEEQASLPALRTAAEALTENDEATRLAFLRDTHERVLNRLAGVYMAAHAVPIGSSAEAAVDGKADAFGEEADSGPPTVWTSGMRESITKLRSSGVMGKLYAFLFENTGVLDDAPDVFDEAFPFSEPREERADRIIHHYQGVAAGSAVVAGVESLIPVAGLAISFSHKQMMDFRARARMSLEIAVLYGVDVREGLNLFLIASTMLDLMDTNDVRVAVASSFAMRLLASSAVRHGAGESVESLVRKLTMLGVSSILSQMGDKGAALAASAAAKSATSSFKSQILGFVTFGVSILLDASASAYTFGKAGEDARNVFRPWATGMMVERGSWLQSQSSRSCAGTMLGEMMWADGTVTPEEEQLLAAHLGRSFYAQDAWMTMDLGEAEQVAQRAAAVGAPGTSGNEAARATTHSCVIDQIQPLSTVERMTVLENLWTMIAVDGVLEASELQRYGEVEAEVIEGAGMTNFDIRETYPPFMRQQVETLLVNPEAFVQESQAEVVQSIPQQERLELLEDIAPERKSLVTCAFHGPCE